MLQMVGNSICRNPGQDHLSPVAEMQESVLVPSGFGQNVRASDISPVLYFLSYLFSRSESQSCPTLCDPMDCGILPARILEWIAFPFSRGSSQPRDRTQVSCIAGGFFTSWITREAQEYWSGWPIPSPAALPDPGIKPGSPALQADSLLAELSGKP